MSDERDELVKRMGAFADREWKKRRQDGLARGLEMVPPAGEYEQLLLDAIAAITAQQGAGEPVAQSDGWLPIESAPKGGGADRTDYPKWVNPPTILLRCGSDGCAIGYWDWYYAEGGAGFTDGVACTEKFTGDPLSLHCTTPPDAWQPLPAAPMTAASVTDNVELTGAARHERE